MVYDKNTWEYVKLWLDNDTKTERYDKDHNWLGGSDEDGEYTVTSAEDGYTLTYADEFTVKHLDMKCPNTNEVL
mgnify:CR=1 FL=1